MMMKCRKFNSHHHFVWTLTIPCFIFCYYHCVIEFLFCFVFACISLFIFLYLSTVILTPTLNENFRITKKGMFFWMDVISHFNIECYYDDAYCMHAYIHHLLLFFSEDFFSSLLFSSLDIMKSFLLLFRI